MPVSPSDRPLQNRCDPFGALHAVAARGTLMGNRGGRLHDDRRMLGARRWASRRWIACECAFKGRRRTVWGAGYTEIFFLDEVTALAAGHRPCFECRRVEAKAFLAASGRADVDSLDRALHRARTGRDVAALARAAPAELPDGAMVLTPDGPAAKSGDRLRPWSFDGYGAPRTLGRDPLPVLTPAPILDALASGYAPRWRSGVCGQAVEKL